jgi:hypothetical protein
MQKPTAGSEREQRQPTGMLDPKRLLGADLLERTSPRYLPDRAKAIAVLRRASELIAYPGHVETEAGLQQVLESAARDVGVLPNEYREIIRNDVELQELETAFLDAVRAAFPR